MGAAGPLIAAGAGNAVSGLLANLTAPEGQQLSTYEGIPGINPIDMLKSSTQAIKALTGLASQNLSEGIHLPSAYAQDLPTFTGGGLPMPIGVTARDPAARNPGLRSLGGLGEGGRSIADAPPKPPLWVLPVGDEGGGGGGGRADLFPPRLPIQGASADDGSSPGLDPYVPTDPGQLPVRGSTPRRALTMGSGTGIDLATGQPAPDHVKGQNAAQLLLEALRGGAY